MPSLPATNAQRLQGEEAAKQSILFCGSLDCFAEPVIGRVLRDRWLATRIPLEAFPAFIAFDPPQHRPMVRRLKRCNRSITARRCRSDAWLVLSMPVMTRCAQVASGWMPRTAGAVETSILRTAYRVFTLFGLCGNCARCATLLDARQTMYPVTRHCKFMPQA
jgi:hypothetical protein